VKKAACCHQVLTFNVSCDHERQSYQSSVCEFSRLFTQRLGFLFLIVAIGKSCLLEAPRITLIFASHYMSK
jgi:hypothetical protein